MAKENDILDSSSEGSPIQGVTGEPSDPGTVKFLRVKEDGSLEVSQSDGDSLTELSDRQDRKSTRLNSSHLLLSRMPSSA